VRRNGRPEGLAAQNEIAPSGGGMGEELIDTWFNMHAVDGRHPHGRSYHIPECFPGRSGSVDDTVGVLRVRDLPAWTRSTDGWLPTNRHVGSDRDATAIKT